MIKPLGILLMIVVAISGCEENETVVPFSESESLLTFSSHPTSEASFTEIDPVVIPINVAGNASSVEVRDESGASVGTVSISSGEGTFTTALTDLGIEAAGSSADLRFVVTEPDGREVRYPFTVNTIAPVSISAPGELLQNQVPAFFNFEVSTENTEVSNITVEQKTGAAGTYTPFADEFTATDSVGIMGINYSVGDTVFVRVSATSEGLTSASEASAVVGTSTFANESEEVQLSSDMPAYDLVAATDTVVGSPAADVTFVLGDMNQVGFQSTNGATFVSTDDSDIYDNADQVATQSLYESGTPASAVVDVEEGDTFIYQTTRDGAVAYGIIRITDVSRTNDDDGDSFAFTHKY